VSLRDKMYENLEQNMLHNQALQGALVESIARRLEYPEDRHEEIRVALYDASVAVAKLPIEVAMIVSEFLLSIKDQALYEGHRKLDENSVVQEPVGETRLHVVTTNE
jgi:hypothetical protein